MKLVKQEYAECALASVCMAKGLVYLKHSRQFHKKNGFMFGDATRTEKRAWLIIANKYLEELLGGKINWFRDVSWDFPVFPDQHISLAGQGVISVVTSNYMRHTVAFSQGRIYDPQESYLANWNDWQRLNPDWEVYDLTQVEK